MRRKSLAIVLVLSLLFTFTIGVVASEEKIKPPQKDWPLPFPVVSQDEVKMPRNATLLPDNPEYVADLPGFINNKVMVNDYGKKVPKYDGVVIRGSKVMNNMIIIPPGGLYYMADTWRGMLPLLGEYEYIAGNKYYYLDFDQVVAVKDDVTIKPGERVAVGDQIYTFTSAVGHESTMANVNMTVNTLHGVDWAFAGLSPGILSFNEDNWFEKGFELGYAQGKAKKVGKKAVNFNYLSGTYFRGMRMAKNRVYKDWAVEGKKITAGDYEINVASVSKGASTIQILKNGKVKAEKELGNIKHPKRLIEDTNTREKLIMKHDEVTVVLDPWTGPTKNGKAYLKVYSGSFNIKAGESYPFDKRFETYPIACPVGHLFGTMITNKKSIILRGDGSTFKGPEGYFKIVVDNVEGNTVKAWHIEDKQGNKSIKLGGKKNTDIDLIAGQGRAVVGLLTPKGKTLLSDLYDKVKEAQK
ncbi:hypothetical protein [Selenihalanaerobacter shriftii]|uniref:Uncharacterized protein n=1 Tax=Selenihalanaerobacter shriftii TaxID=142842 RepID=A0A1T4NM08_9FIRM|nr:hypothetical protein [Selenihalanaerobacter shriftii]SJZ80320.1 hypothetical protein SAMN02745118_01859 [Selenihalanaerobacter shriftii]